ncbi:unnamed protein product [Adineta steineri]|uniref:Uncharacterized protein n=1 Tax=Adineta steineri TaxID=433720 RepID=A0A814CSS4_9BILA|nr:unnamed protein product [Adineta steineri]CAF0946394.1 unnamed protein product [Adineta steineri]CAF3722696.1 unnamed protein product [Adineta steineri]CAF3928171.1 unnamed protein product [Adineta steineri]
MGASGTKEPPRNISFENQLLMTEAALQQLQSSVGKSVPQAVNTRTPGIDSSTSTTITTSRESNNNIPLPKIDTNGTVETWRALASSVNDTELQRLRQEYKEKLLEQERYNREKLNLTKENLAAEIEKVEKKFSKYIYSPICEIERSEIEQCYLANPKQVLTCSIIAEKFIKCVQQHREQSLQIYHTPTPTQSSTTNETPQSTTKESPQQHTYADPLTSKTSATADAAN